MWFSPNMVFPPKIWQQISCINERPAEKLKKVLLMWLYQCRPGCRRKRSVWGHKLLRSRKPFGEYYCLVTQLCYNLRDPCKLRCTCVTWWRCKAMQKRQTVMFVSSPSEQRGPPQPSQHALTVLFTIWLVISGDLRSTNTSGEKRHYIFTVLYVVIQLLYWSLWVFPLHSHIQASNLYSFNFWSYNVSYCCTFKRTVCTPAEQSWI